LSIKIKILHPELKKVLLISNKISVIKLHYNLFGEIGKRLTVNGLHCIFVDGYMKIKVRKGLY